MQSFDSGGVKIAFVDEGSGDPILLIHGFASNVATNWRDARWLYALTGAGHRAIAYDKNERPASALEFAAEITNGK